MIRTSVLANALGIGAAIIATLGIAMSVVPADARSVAAVFPPWWTQAQTFQAASNVGDVVRLGRFSSVVIVRDDRKGLAMRLRAAGALILVNALTFGGCAGQSNVTR